MVYSTDGVGCHCHCHCHGGGGGGGGEGATTVLAKVHCGEMAGIVYFGDKRLGGNGGKQQASMQ